MLAAAFEPAPEDLPAADFKLEPVDLLAVDFEPEPDDLLAVAFEPAALEDFPADALDALPVDLPAVDFPAEDALLAAGFAAVFEAEDLLAGADFAAVFAAGFAEADLLVAEEDLLADDAAFPLPDLLLDAVDFPEFLLFFVVAIAFSLKFFLQLTQEFLR